jgi:hypothetical protein
MQRIFIKDQKDRIINVCLIQSYEFCREGSYEGRFKEDTLILGFQDGSRSEYTGQEGWKINTILEMMTITP